MTLIDLERP